VQGGEAGEKNLKNACKKGMGWGQKVRSIGFELMKRKRALHPGTVAQKMPERNRGEKRGWWRSRNALSKGRYREARVA